jgi:hypothetical protein
MSGEPNDKPDDADIEQLPDTIATDIGVKPEDRDRAARTASIAGLRAPASPVQAG